MKNKRHIIDNTTTATKLFLLVVIVVISFFCLSSCHKNKRKEDVAKIIREWAGKEIKFPEELFCTSMGSDTTCVDLYSDNYKILLYVDSIGCTSCRLNLTQWENLIIESDTAFIQKPEFVFFFQPKIKGDKDVILTLRENRFRHPVFIDKENGTYKMNNFPANPNYQCFLLDKDNKVLLIGDPSNNPNIWTLIKKIVNEQESRVLTTKNGGSFTSFVGNSTLPLELPLKGRKEDAKEMN